MCNLYIITKGRQAILEFTRAMRDTTGFNEPSRDVYPNYLAPVVRVGSDGKRELVPLNWGMPTPPERLTGKADRGDRGARDRRSRRPGGAAAALMGVDAGGASSNRGGPRAKRSGGTFPNP